MNLVERFFAELTVDVVGEGRFASVRQLVRDIEDYLSQGNLNPTPYRWKADTVRDRPRSQDHAECGDLMLYTAP